MSTLTLKADSSRPHSPLGLNRNRASRPTRRASPPAVVNALYLRSWIAHQAASYSDLLQTIAAAKSLATAIIRD